MPCWHFVIQTLFFNIRVGQFEIGLERGFVNAVSTLPGPLRFMLVVFTIFSV